MGGRRDEHIITVIIKRDTVDVLEGFLVHVAQVLQETAGRRLGRGDILDAETPQGLGPEMPQEGLPGPFGGKGPVAEAGQRHSSPLHQGMTCEGRHLLLGRLGIDAFGQR